MPDPGQNPFLVALKKEMAANRYNNLTDNHDRSHPGSKTVEWIPMWRRTLREIFGSIGRCIRECFGSLWRLQAFHFKPEAYFESAAAAYEDVAFLHNLVVDEPSKALVVKLCAFRTMGHSKVRLPRSSPQYWLDQMAPMTARVDAEPLKIDFMDVSLGLYDCRPLGYDMKVYATTGGLACAIVQKQYEFKESVYGYACKVEAGDVVIDAGACWGDTTLYFAHEVGPQGKVFAFEFIPSNMAVLRQNVALNPDLAERITLVERPMWSSSGRKLYYVDWGPGSRVTDDKKRYKYDGVCETLTIDDLVKQQGLSTVDFIKMDIEGAELAALHGAERTIRAHRPKLAISIYHQMSDFTTIPRYLYGLGLTYDFFLDHHTLYENETVLFAIPRGRGL